MTPPLISAGKLGAAAALGLVLVQLAPAGQFNPSLLPPPAPRPIDFLQDIQPLFERHCYKCHAGEKPKSDYRLTDRDSALKGGLLGVAILPGKSDQSPLLHYVAGTAEDFRMPPEGRGDPLTPAQVSLLRAWIDQGAHWAGDDPDAASDATVTTVLGGVIVNRNRRQFRALHWQRDGLSGGLEQFNLHQRLTPDSRLEVHGRLLPDDYLLTLRAEKRHLGFARLGWSEFRRWYDDSGGYFAPFPTPLFRLDRDLHLDLGRAWIDLGLTLPDLPQLVLGYEHQYRDGAKSMLHWGPVTAGPESRNTFPAFKSVSEQAHILKADLAWEPAGLLITDNFRGEWRRLERLENNAASYNLDTGALALTRAAEKHSSFHGANTVRLEKQLTDSFLASAGYLFSHLQADTDLDVSTLNPAALNPLAVAPGWHAQGIHTERESHLFSLGLLGGPWQGFTLSLAPQFEWNRQQTLGAADVDVSLPFAPFVFAVNPEDFRSDLDRSLFTQNLGLRFHRIRRTTLFAEGRFQEERLGHFEEQIDGLTPFLRDTDTTARLHDGRLGFNTSPSARLSLHAHYRYVEKDTTYQNLRKEVSGLLYQGYPALFQWRELRTDETLARLTFHWNPRLKSGLAYQWTASDFRTRLDPVTIPPGISPGGRLLAGAYDSHGATLDSTWTPSQRLFLSAAFTFQNARTTTADHDSPSLEPYAGNLYSVQAAGNYALNHRWDFAAGYSFSAADFSQHNSAAGLPLGIHYHQHALHGGVKHKLDPTKTLGLQYRFYTYAEPGAGHHPDFQAHALFATFTWTWL